MNIYFLYYADVRDRDIGMVLTHTNSYTDEQFLEMIKTIKDQYEIFNTELIGDYLCTRYGFEKPAVVECNQAYV